MVVNPDTDAAGLSPTHDSHIKHTGYESSKKWVCQKKQGEKAKEKLRNGCPLFLDIFSDRRKGSVSYSKKKQTNVRKTGLQLIIPRIIAVLYAISPFGKKLQTFSRWDISPDFEAPFWWNIGTSKVSSICQKLYVGHSQPERMVSNGNRWPNSRSWTYQCHVEVSGKRLKGEKPNHSSPTYLKISWKKNIMKVWSIFTKAETRIYKSQVSQIAKLIGY